jgi:hypothetical protein
MQNKVRSKKVKLVPAVRRTELPGGVQMYLTHEISKDNVKGKVVSVLN